MAFADDLKLLAETKPGMNHVLEFTIKFFNDRNMSINEKKCFALRTDFTMNNRAPIMLERMRKTPLKPQQKIHHLRMNIIPKLLHRLALGRIAKGLLQSFDSNILSFVRELLDLPMDIPVSFYYNNIKDGGLGIPFPEKAIPKSMIKRASKFRDSNDPTTGTTSFQNLLCLCCTILNITSIEAGLSLDIHKQLRLDLYRTIDGSALSEFRTNSSGQIWLNGITNIVSGKKF